eukprot:10164484-Ditylum_brightwellii.AAC.1
MATSTPSNRHQLVHLERISSKITTLPPYTCSNRHWQLTTPLGNWVTNSPYTYQDDYLSPSNGQLYALSN